ncbi:MAG: protein kinase domain-containing protein [Gemmatimonadales bacterium]
MQDVLELLREGLAPRYSVERQIGAGGMARVYLALEQHPRRNVAIKLLEPEFGSRLLYDRFIREIELSSQLNHPHIVPIFAAGETGGMLYYVMPYIEGESLRQRLLKDGRLPLEDALHIALDVADALSYAHTQGIVHRDIKPENILLSGGHAVVADFGVARAISAAGQTLTQAGQAIGSPGYMSPEQAFGTEVDARSDLYSLGCVLFEMLAGAAPTRGPADAKIQNWEALDRGSLHGAPTEVVRGVKHALATALALLPADRFATAAAMTTGLGGSAHRPSLPTRVQLVSRRVWKRVAGVAAILAAIAVGAVLISPNGHGRLSPRRVVVAVIENHTGDRSLDHLGHMAADWVTQGLAQTGLVEVVPSMQVFATSDTSAAHGAGHLDAAGVRRLGRRTGAGTVVSGAYYRIGDSLRFQVEISDAAEGKVLRALDPVVGSAANPLEPIERLRQRVMTALATLTDPRLMNWAGAASQPPSFEAYQEFVEGVDRFVRFDWNGASEHFEQAAAGDSTFTAALIWSAAARLNLGQFGRADSIVSTIERTNRRLPPIDRGYLAWVQAQVVGDRPRALQAARDLVQVAPGSEAQYLLGSEAMALNRPKEAVASYTALGPDRGLFHEYYMYWCDLTAALHLLGDHRRELKEAGEGRRRFPDNLGTLACEVRALAALGRRDDVRRRLAESENLPRQPGWTAADVALLAGQELRAHGHQDAAEEALRQAIAWLETRQATRSDSNHYDLGRAYYLAGRLDDARPMFEPLAALRSEATPSTAPGHIQVESEHILDDVSGKGFLGAIAARQGDREQALRFDRMLARSSRPYLFGRHTFWRARIHALLGDKDQAVDLVRAAFSQGFPYSAPFHTDLAFEALRNHPPFVEILRSKG